MVGDCENCKKANYLCKMPNCNHLFCDACFESFDVDKCKICGNPFQVVIKTVESILKPAIEEEDEPVLVTGNRNTSRNRRRRQNRSRNRRLQIPQPSTNTGNESDEGADILY